MDFTVFIICILVLAVVILAIAFFNAATKSKARLERQKILINNLQENQLHGQRELLESTLNPHLFKNVLNSIQSHAYQTYYALDKLANVLDYILYDSRQPFVSVKEEIAFAQNLIEINKIKLSPLFELQVKTKIDVADEFYLQKVMAPLLTIDLVENAFKHADIQNQDAFIKILIQLEQGGFTLSVVNKISEKPPMPKPKGGLGSKTLDQRLQTIYGSHYTLERTRKEDHYIAELKIDFNAFKDKVRIAG
jgi:LytS/YehU family sensor histidine kinase